MPVVNAWNAGVKAVERAEQLKAYAFMLSAVNRAVQPPSPVDPPTVTTPAPPSVTVVTAETFSTPDRTAPAVLDWPWPCIAEAETGTDWSMHGSTYSTAFGLVNDIVEDYGSPEEQAAVFSGTATAEQQVDIASRFAADHGFGGWGVLTKSKCGLS